MINHAVYVYNKNMVGTTSRLAPSSIAIVDGFKKTGPLVSCLMVTRGDPDFARASLSYFHKQTYVNKELIIVCDAISDKLRRVVGDQKNVRLIEVSRGLSLGLLRNISVEEARGEIICQWDDDDIYGVRRIEHGVGALIETHAHAVFLRQWLIWSPSQQALKLSRSRLWEGSMLAYKKELPAYEDLRRREDTTLVESIGGSHVLALMDDPLSYCYCIHGNNTFAGSHMQQMLDEARLRFEYASALAAFSSSLSFADHPAMRDIDRSLVGQTTANDSQMKRIQNHLAIRQFIRRFRHMVGSSMR